MNQKTSKLLRQYARATGYYEKSVKSEFQKESKESQVKIAQEMRAFLKIHNAKRNFFAR